MAPQAGDPVQAEEAGVTRACPHAHTVWLPSRLRVNDGPWVEGPPVVKCLGCGLAFGPSVAERMGILPRLRGRS